MGELPIFTAHAHVFTIDPKTKKTWIPSSVKAVEINYFFDPTKNCFRIVSIEDTSNGKQVIINSTLTEKMVFKKTSQKFGQWTDSKQCTIFGLGFNSEEDLDTFVEQFKNCIETMKSRSIQNPLDVGGNKEVSGKREVLAPALGSAVAGSGRQWSSLSATTPSLNNSNAGSKIASLEAELERMNKKFDELKLQHQEEIKRLRDELDHTNSGALANTIDNFKNAKELKTRVIELETENNDLKKKVKELNESKTINQIQSVIGMHQEMESAIKKLSNIHSMIGQKLVEITICQPTDMKPPNAYGL